MRFLAASKLDSPGARTGAFVDVRGFADAVAIDQSGCSGVPHASRTSANGTLLCTEVGVWRLGGRRNPDVVRLWRAALPPKATDRFTIALAGAVLPPASEMA